jgi:16S rRNA processing protein RimM
MLQEFIPVGQIVNAHGVRGEMKLLPRGFSAEFVAQFRTLYLNGTAVHPTRIHAHKDTVLFSIPEVTDRDQALERKGTTVSIRRQDANLPEGRYFDAELLGLAVYDTQGHAVGTLTEVLSYPAHELYRVEGERCYLIPAVPEVFIRHIDMVRNRMEVQMLEGLELDEN